jgi:hypothetical protein
MDILHHGPDNAQATRFRGEDVNLIRAPSNMAQQAFNGIRAANGAMHHLQESIKSQPMLFIFPETVDRFWIAQVIFALKGCSLRKRLLFGRQLPDS